MNALLPTVSVCLLTYNNAKVLRQTVRSILSQEFSDFELIISDDRSKDETWAVVTELAEEDQRIRAVQPEQNLGMAGNANFAVAASVAPYVAILHHDDIYSPNLLQRWVDILRKYPRVGFVSNAYAVIGSDRVDYHPFEECTNGTLVMEKYLLPLWGCPVRGTAMVRRSCWNALGGMRMQFGLLADVDLWMRLAARWDVGYVREPLISVRNDHPVDYPSEYSRWSWERMKVLYEIHGTNRAEYFSQQPWRQMIELAKYRARVSGDELRWLAYAVYKKRFDMLATSGAVRNQYEFLPVRYAREMMSLIGNLLMSRI